MNRRTGRRHALALALVLAAPAAVAQAADEDAGAPEPARDPTPEPAAPEPVAAPEPAADAAPPAPPVLVKPLPAFMRNKRRMREEDLEDKVEGGYFTGLPLINSDPDYGIGFGARVLYFHNGSRSNQMFEHTPYRHRLYGQAFFTTNGFQYHTLDYDAPYVGGTPMRLRASLVYERNTAANYFGAGPRSLGRLRHPGEDRAFHSLATYTESLRQVRPGNVAFTRYDQFIVDRPAASVTLERDFFGGVVRVLGGFTASYVDIAHWTGRVVSADDPVTGRTDIDARQAPTRLQQDCAAGIARGCEGGFNNTLKLGVAFDTRDFEPDPNSGFFVDLTSEISTKAFGSEASWARVTFSPRAYWSPFPKLTDLVLAGRLVGSVQTEDTPITSLSELSFTERNWFGLGGLRTIRGFKQSRFVGRTIALANIELRWTFFDFKIRRKQHFALMLAPFFDIGRVFDTIDDFELRRFRNGQGAGFRIAWNQATIIVFDYGVSREGSSFYVNFGHAF